MITILCAAAICSAVMGGTSAVWGFLLAATAVWILAKALENW